MWRLLEQLAQEIVGARDWASFKTASDIHTQTLRSGFAQTISVPMGDPSLDFRG